MSSLSAKGLPKNTMTMTATKRPQGWTRLNTFKRMAQNLSGGPSAHTYAVGVQTYCSDLMGA